MYLRSCSTHLDFSPILRHQPLKNVSRCGLHKLNHKILLLYLESYTNLAEIPIDVLSAELADNGFATDCGLTKYGFPQISDRKTFGRARGITPWGCFRHVSKETVCRKGFAIILSQSGEVLVGPRSLRRRWSGPRTSAAESCQKSDSWFHGDFSALVCYF